jgi:anti-repressor protein
MTDISLQVFNSEDFGEIRVLAIDSEPWFVARDVTDALGLDRTATRRLDDDEKDVRSMHTPGGEQEVTIVTESGFYNLVMASKKPEARAFKRWVTHDVLPSIRRHGMYATPQTVERMLADPDTMIATLKALKAERQRTQALMEDNARMLPKSVAYDSIIDTEGTMTITQAARYLAQMDRTITRTRLFAYLRADGIICKQGNAPTKRAIQQGLARQIMSERADGKANDPYARLTQKGLDWCVSHYVRLPTQMRS